MQADDWFVNFKTGGVVYVKSESKLTQEQSDKIGAGDAKNYSRLGADNMFGDKVPYGLDDNILDNKAYNVENPEKFMAKQGYEKAENVTIKEQVFTQSGGFGPGENIKTGSSSLKQIGDSKVTYAKPENLDQKTILGKSGGKSDFSSSESVTYRLIKPYGQENSLTAQFYENRTSKVEKGGNAIINLIRIIVESDIFKKVK